VSAGRQVVVADVDWPELIASVGGPARAARFRGVPAARAIIGRAASRVPGPDLPDLTLLPEAERTEALISHLRAAAALVLGADDTVGPDDNLMDLGLSSFTTLELSARLREAGVDAPPSVIFEHPTPAGLASFLSASLTGTPPSA
jgi:aryl carrier-like protein